MVVTKQTMQVEGVRVTIVLLGADRFKTENINRENIASVVEEFQLDLNEFDPYSKQRGGFTLASSV